MKSFSLHEYNKNKMYWSRLLIRYITCQLIFRYTRYNVIELQKRTCLFNANLLSDNEVLWHFRKFIIFFFLLDVGIKRFYPINVILDHTIIITLRDLYKIETHRQVDKKNKTNKAIQYKKGLMRYDCVFGFFRTFRRYHQFITCLWCPDN